MIEDNVQMLTEAYTPCGEFLFEIDRLLLKPQELYVVGEHNIILAKNLIEPIDIQSTYTIFFDNLDPKAECVMSFDNVVLSRTKDRNRFGYSYEKTNTWMWNIMTEKKAA